MLILKKIEEDSSVGRILRNLLSLYPYKKWKLGKSFFQFYNLLFQNEKLSFEEMQSYQLNEMKRVVNQAYNNTVFYKEKYDEAGFHPSQLKSLSDVSLIPVLTRSEVKENSSKMIDINFKGKIYQSVTSGTTAKPLTVYRNKATAQKEWAAICYQWSRVGYQPGDGRIEFRGILDKATTFIHLKHERVLRVNIVEMDENNLDLILAAIRTSNYKFIHGYPGSIYKFFNLVKRKYGQFPTDIKIKSFLLASENIFDWQIELMREMIPEAKVICHYGQAEKVALGAWNNPDSYRDENYHFIPSYSFVEVRENAVIGTSFISDVMPLIRYEVNDSMKLKSAKPIAEKTLYPVVEQIRGRIEDITYTTEGKSVPPALVTFPFKKLKLIDSCKITQVGKTKFEILVQSSKEKEELSIEINELEQKMKVIYGESATFNFLFTDKIPLTKNGKFKWVEYKV
ncbi:MAG: phenylacetate--CoA ligase family protein [Vicingus serpentipes]|nr:phenylacetate--CoA ligase family protein [Vicingus serpentipes]